MEEKYYNNPQDIFRTENDSAGVGGQQNSKSNNDANGDGDGYTDTDNNKNSSDMPESGVSSDIAQNELHHTNEAQKYETDPNTSYDTLNLQDKLISEFKSKGFGIDSTHVSTSVRGGVGGETCGDIQESLLILTSSGKSLNEVMSALQGIARTMPCT